MKKLILKPIFNIEGELDELPVKQGNLPALEGPRANRSWTKFLRIKKVF